MDNYSEAIVEANKQMKELHNLLLQCQYAHAFSKIEDIEYEMNRLKNWCWKQTQDKVD